MTIKATKETKPRQQWVTGPSFTKDAVDRVLPGEAASEWRPGGREGGTLPSRAHPLGTDAKEGSRAQLGSARSPWHGQGTRFPAGVRSLLDEVEACSPALEGTAASALTSGQGQRHNRGLRGDPARPPAGCVSPGRFLSLSEPVFFNLRNARLLWRIRCRCGHEVTWCPGCRADILGEEGEGWGKAAFPGGGWRG